MSDDEDKKSVCLPGCGLICITAEIGHHLLFFAYENIPSSRLLLLTVIAANPNLFAIASSGIVPIKRIASGGI